MAGDRDTVARWLSGYDAQGWHRSGSATDRRCAGWIAAEAAALGASTRTEAFPFSRLTVRHAAVRLDATVLPAVPLYDALFPTADPIEGALGSLGSDAALGVTEAGPTPVEGDPLSTARRHGRHRAIIAVSHGRELALRNAESVAPFASPVVQVSGRYSDLLQRSAEAGATATVAVRARRAAGTAVNVIASVEGSKPEEPPVMVLTPRSGWWHCAAERGGGLACWLAALGESVRHPPRRTVHYVATSGHELAYAGFHAFLARHGLDRRATWVHLGANIGARGGTLGVAASDPGMAERLLSSLSPNAGGPHARLLPAPVGEGGELHNVGATVVSLVGTNELFHQRSDRYPDNVDVGTVHRVASVVTELVGGIAGWR